MFIVILVQLEPRSVEDSFLAFLVVFARHCLDGVRCVLRLYNFLEVRVLCFSLHSICSSGDRECHIMAPHAIKPDFRAVRRRAIILHDTIRRNIRVRPSQLFKLRWSSENAMRCTLHSVRSRVLLQPEMQMISQCNVNDCVQPCKTDAVECFLTLKLFYASCYECPVMRMQMRFRSSSCDLTVRDPETYLSY